MRIAVYDMLGRCVATAFEGFREAGTQSVSFRANTLPPGQYVYRLEAGSTTLSKMMSVVR